jgi:hypothetical protein
VRDGVRGDSLLISTERLRRKRPCEPGACCAELSRHGNGKQWKFAAFRVRGTNDSIGKDAGRSGVGKIQDGETTPSLRNIWTDQTGESREVVRQETMRNSLVR